VTRVAVAAACVLVAACDSHLHRGAGTVVEVRLELGQIVLDHREIPGFMPAMTMSFDVAPALVRGVAPGDRVDFELSAEAGRLRIVALERVAQGVPPAPGGARLAAVPPDDDLAPPFALTDQDGRSVSLESLRGKWLLLDFVYTTCPGPCPILTSKHVAVQKTLPDVLRPMVHFVSISLDPVHDTPAKLRAYAEVRGADLSSWSFLTGAPDAVAAVLERYGVGSVRREFGEIEHVVVTFLIDDQGRVVRRFFGLDHESGEIRREFERRLGAAGTQ
jgi:protein SCO1/2